jgi:hypothetical protein
MFFILILPFEEVVILLLLEFWRLALLLESSFSLADERTFWMLGFIIMVRRLLSQSGLAEEPLLLLRDVNLELVTDLTDISLFF